MAEDIIRVEVASSELRAVGYEPEASILEVEFQNGRVYQYSAVPQQMFENLLVARSKGRFFNGHIRDNFACKRLR